MAANPNIVSEQKQNAWRGFAPGNWQSRVNVREFIQREFGGMLGEVKEGGLSGQDYKSALQERLQAAERPLPEYRLVGSLGPDHRKQFQVAVFVDDVRLAEATGPSKKEAEQDAARLALSRLLEDNSS